MLADLKIRNKVTVYVTANRNSPLNNLRKAYYMASLILALEAGRRVIFIDETGINFQSRKRQHYAPHGERWSFQRGKPLVANTTCLLATSQHGLEASLFVDGAADSGVYLHFVKTLVDADPEFDHPSHNQRPLLVADNVACHHSSLFKSWAHWRGLQVLYTPSYCPMLNSVEFANGYLKSKLATLNLPSK